jgi:hypothetical protein
MIELCSSGSALHHVSVHVNRWLNPTGVAGFAG